MPARFQLVSFDTPCGPKPQGVSAFIPARDSVMNDPHDL